jgi:ribosomal protein S18 acetylase RimI-like enzyme
MRQASVADLDRLVALMAEFYAESGYPLTSQHATRAFAALLADERLGRIWLLQAQGADVGYLVVTLGFSMEYGGFDAFVDDLFIQPPFRGAGLGTRALGEARAFCQARGVRALHLEVEPDNTAAQAFYRKTGFASTGRQLLTLRLAVPSPAA